MDDAVNIRGLKRVAVDFAGEVLGMKREEATFGKIVHALKKMGVDYVFDTAFSADLTIMEEGNEFLERLKKGETKVRPMFTSCCPGWVRFVKSQFPHMVPQLSTAKSPQQMFGAVMKTYFADSIGVKPENIYTVSIMPCVAKKGEAKMELYHEEYAGHDIDAVLTTRELERMIRSAYYLVNGKNPDVLKLYENYMGKPLSHKAHMLLHTDHNAWEMPV